MIYCSLTKGFLNDNRWWLTVAFMRYKPSARAAFEI